MTSEVTRALKQCVALLERLGVPYAAMGGLAVGIYAIPQSALNLDFLIRLGSWGGIKPKRVGGMHVVNTRLTVDSQPAFNIDIEFFLAESPFHDSVLSRRQSATLHDGAAVWFVSAEDLVLLKLAAGRGRDLADVTDILAIQGQLDTAYLRRWAGQLEISEKLEEALASVPDLDGA